MAKRISYKEEERREEKIAPGIHKKIEKMEKLKKKKKKKKQYGKEEKEKPQDRKSYA